MANADSGGVTRPRPTSPHLQIYTLLINMVMSIVHRITGAALYFGSVLLAVWLIAAASGPEAFEQVNALFGSVIGRLVLVVYTWALVHHMAGGIRHLIWDSHGLHILARLNELLTRSCCIIFFTRQLCQASVCKLRDPANHALPTAPL